MVQGMKPGMQTPIFLTCYSNFLGIWILKFVEALWNTWCVAARNFSEVAVFDNVGNYSSSIFISLLSSPSPILLILTQRIWIKFQLFILLCMAIEYKFHLFTMVQSFPGGSWFAWFKKVCFVCMPLNGVFWTCVFHPPLRILVSDVFRVPYVCWKKLTATRMH